MGVAIVTGSAGLVGSEVVRHVADKGMVVVHSLAKGRVGKDGPELYPC
jgi:NAD(P)-dependent dehydrogenase (short-subunit alcohol dehydrogenase family)